MFSAYEALQTTPFPFLHPLCHSILTFGAQISRCPNGNRESINADNECKEFLISEEEAEAFNRNSIATEYRSDDAIDKDLERVRCIALGAIGSERGYGCGRGRSQELLVDDKEWRENDLAEHGQTDVNQDEDENESEATIRFGGVRVGSNDAVCSCGCNWNQRHDKEASVLIQGEQMPNRTGGAENSCMTCETPQHCLPNHDQGKKMRNVDPDTGSFQTAGGGGLQNSDPGRVTRIAISCHEFSYSLDFQNFLVWFYNSMPSDSRRSFVPFAATSDHESCGKRQPDILPSQPVICASNEDHGG